MKLFRSVLILSFCLPTITAFADDIDDAIRDEVDRAKGSPGLSSGQFLAVPIPVSNPTVGSGLQVALLYLHPEKENADEDTPNATTGVGGMYTDTDTSVVGIFHDNYLFNDRLRVRGGIATSDLNIEYFGANIGPDLGDHPIEYNLNSDFAMAQGLGRIPGTQNWFLGLRAIVMEADISFHLEDIFPGIPDIGSGINMSNLALVSEYDSRDNNYYPTSGIQFNGTVSRDDEEFGSDYNFTRYTASYNQYFKVNDKNVIAARLYATEVEGESPFFLLPSLKLRGFASGRYQDEAVVSAHVEWRHKFHPRWGFMMAAEAGRVGDSLGDLNGSDLITSISGGIRWQVSADQPMHLGLDVGFSGNESAIYIQIGEKF